MRRDGGAGRVLRGRALRDAVGDQVGDDLGVGLGAEDVAAADELGAQLAVVLDDAVVDDDDVAGGVGVRVGVDAASPCRASPSACGRCRCLPGGSGAVEAGAQVRELADVLGDEQAPVVVEDGDAGAIVAAVLELGEAVEDDGRRLFAADVADDAAHAAPPAAATRPGTPNRRTAGRATATNGDGAADVGCQVDATLTACTPELALLGAYAPHFVRP